MQMCLIMYEFILVDYRSELFHNKSENIQKIS